MARSITFRACLPQIQSAIKVGGDGSMRVQLDVPASDRQNAIALAALNDVVLVVTVEVDAAELDDGDPEGEVGASAFAQPQDGKAKANKRTAWRPLGPPGG